MRIILWIALFCSFATLKAQTVLPFSATGSQSSGFINNVSSHDSLSTHKWFLSMYDGISTGISFFNRGNATIFAAPLGLQLNRRLNNNFYAFANVSVAPAYTSFSPSFTTQGYNKLSRYNTPGANGFGMYPAASLGIMYVNDQKTFSISGSISAERNSYFPLPYYPAINARQSRITPLPGR